MNPKNFAENLLVFGNIKDISAWKTLNQAFLEASMTVRVRAHLRSCLTKEIKGSNGMIRMSDCLGNALKPRQLHQLVEKNQVQRCCVCAQATYHPRAPCNENDTCWYCGVAPKWNGRPICNTCISITKPTPLPLRRRQSMDLTN
jgi:hypothetical protein